MKNKEFDIIICVGSQHQKIVRKTISSILQHFEFKMLWIIANKKVIENIKNNISANEKIQFIHEDTLLANSTIEILKGYFSQRKQDSKRAGWYYQQFLKMQVCTIIESEYYLIWDADTIPLQKITFFEENDSLLVQTSNEYHMPYFETINRLLNLEKAISDSFITEHMMIFTGVMNNLITEIQQINFSKPWPIIVLDNIDNENLSKSGFSEYETYGTYLWNKPRPDFKIRKQKLTSYRYGTQLFSSNPSHQALRILKELEFDYVTFEVWDSAKNIKLLKNKIKSVLYSILVYTHFDYLAKTILKSIISDIKHN